jgi:hypothetical protein
MTGFGLLIAVSLALLFTPLLESFLLLILELLDLVCFATLSQDILSSFPGIEEGLVECWIALLAHIRLGDILIVDADSNTNVMLPNAAFITWNTTLANSLKPEVGQFRGTHHAIQGSLSLSPVSIAPQTQRMTSTSSSCAAAFFDFFVAFFLGSEGWSRRSRLFVCWPFVARTDLRGSSGEVG